MKAYVSPDRQGSRRPKMVVPARFTSETFRNIALGMAGVISSVMIPVVGLALSNRDKDRELARQYVALGVDILQKVPESKEDPVRAWAIEVVNHYSDIKLSDQAQAALSEEPIFTSLTKITDERLKSLTDSAFSRGTLLWDARGSVDFVALKREGIRFVYVKASEGRTGRDRSAATYVAAARAAGIRVGIWHYFKQDVPAEEQAANFLSAAEGLADDLLPIVDCEETISVSPRDYGKRVRLFLDRVETKFGVTPGIYTGRGFADTHFSSGFERYPLFLASYNGQGVPKPPKGWKDITFWHVAEGTGGDKASSRLDVALFKGDIATLPLLSDR